MYEFEQYFGNDVIEGDVVSIYSLETYNDVFELLASLWPNMKAKKMGTVARYFADKWGLR